MKLPILLMLFLLLSSSADAKPFYKTRKFWIAAAVTVVTGVVASKIRQPASGEQKIISPILVSPARLSQ